MARKKAVSVPASLVESKSKDQARTPYSLFVQLCRRQHRQKYPDEAVSLEEFSMKCSERWKSMTEKEKLAFSRMAAAEDAKRPDAKRRKPEVQKTAAAVATSARKETKPSAAEPAQQPKSRKKKKDPNAPKRSISAFFWFSQEERKKVLAANPNMGIGAVAKELGRRWSDTEAELRSKYEKMAEKDKIRYGKEKEAYQQRLKDDERSRSVKNDGGDEENGSGEDGN